MGLGQIPRTKNEILLSELDEKSGELVNDSTSQYELAEGDELLLVGAVHSHIPEDRCLVVRAYETTVALAEDTMLCIHRSVNLSHGEIGLCQGDRRQKLVVSAAGVEATPPTDARAAKPVEKSNVVAIGGIHEVFGPLHKPYYVVRYRRLLGEAEEVAEGVAVPENTNSLGDSMKLGSSVYCLQRSAHLVQVSC